MTGSELDPIETFVAKVREHISGSHVVVGPVSYHDETRRLIEVVGAARQPTVDRPFLVLKWFFEIPAPEGTSAEAKSNSEWGTWQFLANLLRRDFAAVEDYGNQLELARAVERLWPCPAATSARERIEERFRLRAEWESRRKSHIAQRQREGIGYAEANAEYCARWPSP